MGFDIMSITQALSRQERNMSIRQWNRNVCHFKTPHKKLNVVYGEANALFMLKIVHTWLYVDGCSGGHDDQEEEEEDEETLVSLKRSQMEGEEFSDEEINYMMQHMMPKVFWIAV